MVISSSVINKSPSPPPPSPSPPAGLGVAGRRLEAAVAVKGVVVGADEDAEAQAGEATRAAASELPAKGFLRTFEKLWGRMRTGHSASA